MKKSKQQTRSFKGHEEFIQFVRAVSPEADVTSVLLFGQAMRMHGLLKQLAEKKLKTVGLSWAKFRLLRSLVQCEQHGNTSGMLPSELSASQSISRNTVSALISSLEQEGLIRRELHGDDRRKFLIHLTPKGRKMMRAELSDQFKYAGQHLETFDAKERQTLLDLLTRLNVSLSEKAKTYKKQSDH